MLKELKFVQGAVAKKSFVPELTHFQIRNGFVRGYNGSLALCAPIALDFDCLPKAEALVKAIQNCNDTIQLSVTQAGRLSIKSGTFKAFIDCFDTHETPDLEPEGEPIEFDGVALLHALKTIAPFVGDDASRPWANGALLKGQSVYATNNVVLVEYWVGVQFPKILNLPRSAIKEIIRIGEPPTSAQCTENSITFHYPGGRWIRSQLLAVQWPDLELVLSKESTQSPLDKRLFDGLKVVKPFVDKMGRILFDANGIRTHHDEGEGAAYEIEGFNCEGVYALEMLELLDGVANTIDFTAYPNAALFYGDRLRGAIIGLLL
jgi:DNA polymerase III sliding clamp (beta) subunit (PCNA family)